MALLQRKNFRCPRDGGASPIRTSGLGSGASSTSSPVVVVSHAELPPRQRKRLQVGTTNLPKTDVSSTSDTKDRDPSDALAAAARRVCATNIDLLKATVGTSNAGNGHRSTGDIGASTSAVIGVEPRRLRSLTLNGSSTAASSRDDTNSDEHARTVRTATPDGSRAVLALLDGGGRVTRSQSLPLDNNAHGSSDASDRSDPHDARAARQRREHAVLARHRARLHEAFVQKYGSMRAVFKAFDRDGDGVISFQRFANMVEASEVGLEPEETRAVYAHADANGDNALAFDEFAQMFTAASSGIGDSDSSDVRNPSGKSGSVNGDAFTSDPSSSFALKHRSPLELTPRSRERMKALRGKVTAQLAAQHSLAVSVHGGKHEQLLLYAFKQFDADNDGALTYEQTRRALGRGFLQLELHASELDEMIRLIDRNGDERISMREFVQYFGVGEREVPTDLLDYGRTKALAALHQTLNAHVTPREEFDAEYVARRRAAAAAATATTVESPLDVSSGCLPENLSKRIAAAPVFQTPPSVSTWGSPSRASARGLNGSKSVPALGSLRGVNSDIGRCGDGDRSAAVDSRGARDLHGVSSSRGPEVNQLTPVSQDRFAHRRKERTDWTRVGLGGDGVARGSDLYLDERERFRTTTNEAFSPLRRGQNASDLFRDQPATSTREHEARDRPRRARYERTQQQLQQMADARVAEHRLSDWRMRANVRASAEQQFVYLDRMHELEQRAAVKDMQTQKRHGGVRYLRMWAGSPDSQFNASDSASSIGTGDVGVGGH